MPTGIHGFNGSKMKIYRLQFEQGYSSVHSQPHDPVQKEYVQHVQGNHGDPSIIANWRGIEFYLMNPLLPIPDFFWWGYYVGCRKETFSRIADIVAQHVVPLPVSIENATHEYVLLFVRNVLHITRDDEIKAWSTTHGWHQPMPYLLTLTSLTRPQLFLNDTFLRGQILCASGCGDETADFYLHYRKLGFTGIDFIPIKEA
jgi:hypothetical protein